MKRNILNTETRRHRDSFSLSLLPLLSLCLCVSVFVLSACDRRELTYYMESEITVTADWSRADLAEESEQGATLVVYPQNGGEPYIYLMGEREGITIRLPEGHYDAVLFNHSFDDFKSIAFRGHDALETLEAFAKEVVTRADTRVIISAPEKLSAAVARDFRVTEDMLGNYAPAVARGICPDEVCRMHFTPLPLTRKMEVMLHVKGLVNVREARCTLHGVPLSIFLHDGSVREETGGQEFVVSNPELNEGSWQDGTLTGTINLFGFDEDLPHEITLKALLVDGQTVAEQTLENLIVREQVDEDGSVILYIEATTPDSFPYVKPEGGGESGFDADVEDWGGDEKVDLPL